MVVDVLPLIVEAGGIRAIVALGYAERVGEEAADNVTGVGWVTQFEEPMLRAAVDSQLSQDCCIPVVMVRSNLLRRIVADWLSDTDPLSSGGDSESGRSVEWSR